jgi:hypothetical protein
MSIKDELTSPKATMRQAIKNNSKKLGLNNTSNNKIQYLMGANNMLLMGDNIMFKPKIKSSSVSSSNNNQYGYEDEDDEQEENENDEMNRLMRVNQDEFEVEQDEDDEDEEDDEENEEEDDEDDNNNEDQDEDDDQENFLQNAANFSSQAAALQFYVKLPGKKKNINFINSGFKT